MEFKMPEPKKKNTKKAKLEKEEFERLMGLLNKILKFLFGVDLGQSKNGRKLDKAMIKIVQMPREKAAAELMKRLEKLPGGHATAMKLIQKGMENESIRKMAVKYLDGVPGLRQVAAQIITTEPMKPFLHLMRPNFEQLGIAPVPSVAPAPSLKLPEMKPPRNSSPAPDLRFRPKGPGV